MTGIAVYFSDYFDVDPNIIEKYGAVNISLINDIPLFIDPFLLFNSKNPDFQAIHSEMIRYLYFLQEQARMTPVLSKGMSQAWFRFSEVKQTWLGFSQSGNSGRGMGADFANGLFAGLTSIFKDFSETTITKSPHIEKMCLISSNVGRDKISDFTTNFAKRYLLEYTQEFAKQEINQKYCRNVKIRRVSFNWDTHTWQDGSFYLPYHGNDFVLLTPKDILTRDDTFINRADMIRSIEQISIAIPDGALCFELEQYLASVLNRKVKVTKAEREWQTQSFIRQHPELIDYYLRHKEEHAAEATIVSKDNVRDVQFLFNTQVEQLITLLEGSTPFYQVVPDAHDEAKKRVEYLKHVIEDQEGYRIFYQHDGTAIKREADLQVIYRLVWYGSSLDVNREVNNGRGPVDYKISFGRTNSTLVEFKLASNAKLKQNLAKQVEVYKVASETDRAIKVILFFTDTECKKVYRILDELQLTGNADVILIDARKNKESASNVKI